MAQFHNDFDKLEGAEPLVKGGEAKPHSSKLVTLEKKPHLDIDFTDGSNCFRETKTFKQMIFHQFTRTVKF